MKTGASPSDGAACPLRPEIASHPVKSLPLIPRAPAGSRASLAPCASRVGPDKPGFFGRGIGSWRSLTACVRGLAAFVVGSPGLTAVRAFVVGPQGMAAVRAFVVAFVLGSGLAHARPLRWAVDATGGAPYAFDSVRQPGHIVGFEVDLVEAVARHVGERLGEAVGVEVVRGDYARLVGYVARGDADLAMNGLEERSVSPSGQRLSHAYFVANEVWTLRTDGTPVPRRGEMRGRRIGTLPATFAEELLRQESASPMTYDGGQGEMFDDVLFGRSDAVLIDEPVARYYGGLRSGLRIAPSSFPATRYVGVVSRDGGPFADAILAGIDDVLASGEAASTFARWGILNADTRALCTVSSPLPEATELTDWENAHRDSSRLATHGEAIVRALPMLLRGLGNTLFVSIMAMCGAVFLGAVLALTVLFAPSFWRGMARAYIELFRGTPLFVQLTILYFGLPQVGITLSPMTAGILGLSLNYAASEAENFRSGFQGVPPGLVDAAHVLGLSRGAALRHVVFPLALRASLPPITNDFLALLKDSALVSIVTVSELSRSYMTLATSTGAFLEMGIVIALIYLVAGLPFVALARAAEKTLGRGMKRVGDRP